MTGSAKSALHYALFSWQQKRLEPEGAAVFTYHNSSDYGVLLSGLLFLLAIETSIAHIFLARYSAIAAWILTASTVYLMLWLLGDYRAAALSPILIDDKSLHMSIGLRWKVEVALDDIETLQRATDRVRRKTPGYLKAALFGEPQFLLVLKRPGMATGPLGLTRSFRLAGLGLDEPARFEEELTRRLKTERQPSVSQSL